MTDKGKVKGKPTAREKLDQSHLKPDKLEGMGDIDLRSLVLKLRGTVGIDVVEKVTDVVLERTIEGASTVTVSVIDDDRRVLRSNKMVRRTDIEIDGLWFRLLGLNKQDDNLSIVFEDREVALLRTYFKKRTALRSKVTRAEFVLSLLREVKETKIKYKIPELHKVQPIEKKQDLQTWGGQGGLGGEHNIEQPPPERLPQTHGGGPPSAAHNKLTVKGQEATKGQMQMATVIIRVGLSMQARRKVLVAAIMTAIQESTLTNLSGGDRDSVGLFQQRASWGSFADRHDPATASKLFFGPAIKEDKAHPGEPLWTLCQNVQHSAFPSAYAKWASEADALVDAYGEIGSTSGSNNMAPSQIDTAQSAGAGGAAYMFYRGVPPTTQGGTAWGHENSWTCIQRLAGEVNWRSFMVAGTMWFVSEEFLFKMATTMRIAEFMPGIDSIDFDYKENKKAAILTVRCRAHRWAAPPGAAVGVYGMGPVDGRYIVSTIRRSLFSTDAEITLKKPRPVLPEPAQQTVGGSQGQFPVHVAPREQFKVGTILVQPIPAKYNKGHGGVHDTLGLPGYPAIDFFAKPGSPVIAPETGEIVKLSGHDPKEGAPLGAGGPLGWSIYLTGRSGTTYYMTHLSKRFVKNGDQVGEADVIATVADYDKYGRASHTHVGVNGGSISIQELGAAEQAVK